ncbi:MAG: prolipoprotein diacylglyceryl transferase family protein [Candidatus Babeliales bacterium]
MKNMLFQLCGPIAIRSFGLFLFLSLIVVVPALFYHPLRKRFLTEDDFYTLICLLIGTTFIGGRLFFFLSSAESFSIVSFFCPWVGGIRVIGSLLANILGLFIWCHYKKIPFLAIADLIALHAPLCKSIIRLGCFCAGCCYGLPSQLPWSVYYTDPESLAPLYSWIHPTQLYSSLLLFMLFITLTLYRKAYSPPFGDIALLYLVGSSIERFSLDLLRGDCDYFTTPWLPMFTVHQWYALIIGIIAFLTWSIRHTKHFFEPTVS